MNKHSVPSYATVFCGIDVSAASLAVAVQREHPPADRPVLRAACLRQRRERSQGADRVAEQGKSDSAGVTRGDRHLLAGLGSRPGRGRGHRGRGVEPEGGQPVRPDAAAVQDRRSRRAGAGRVQPAHALRSVAHSSCVP